MKEKSIYVKNLDEIQNNLSQLFKSNSFKKKGRTYNKTLEDNIVHVINFQSGEYPISNYVIPGIRENLYGKFTVNLGVFIPCVNELETRSKIPKFIQEYHCSIRVRFGELLNSTNDIFWNLNSNLSKISERLKELFTKAGFSFLNQYLNYQDIIKYFEQNKELPFNNPDRSKFIISLIYIHLNEREKAKQLIEEILKESGHNGFKQHVLDTSKRINLFV